MKVLYLNNVVPFPPDSGERIRKLQMLSALRREHEVWLLAAAPDRAALDRFRGHYPDVRLVEAPMESVGIRGRFAEATREALSRQRFDVVHVGQLWHWPGVKALLALPVVLDAHNVETQLMRRIRALDASKASELDVLAVEALERQAFRRASLVLACSGPEAETIQALAPATRVAVVPNAIDLESFAPLEPPAAAAPPRAIFVGMLSYWPNVDGCEHLVRSLLPLMRARVPGLAVRIVGKYPSAEVMSLAGEEGVEIVTDVPDLRPHYAVSQVSVVPLRVGQGTRFKILEALALCRPVVTTSIGCEGLELTGGEHMLVADGAQEFVEAVGTLFDRPERARNMALAGRGEVERCYSWDVAAERALEAYREVLG